MKTFSKIGDGNNNTFIPFIKWLQISNNSVSKVFDFAYEMAFGNGEHRNHRSGGTMQRNSQQIFIDTFQGKIAEFGFYEAMNRLGLHPSEPDCSIFGLGVWDSFDETIFGKKISIKSTKHFGKFLLLECKDYDRFGTYLPNNCRYDYIFLMRIKPACQDYVISNTINFNLPKEMLKQIFINQQWHIDSPRYITGCEFAYQIIADNHCIHRGEILTGKAKMDADNYYVQFKDMHTIEEFYKEISYYGQH